MQPLKALQNLSKVLTILAKSLEKFVKEFEKETTNWIVLAIR